MARAPLTPPSSRRETEDECKKAATALHDKLGVNEHPPTVFRNSQDLLQRFSYYATCSLPLEWEGVLKTAKSSEQEQELSARIQVHIDFVRRVVTEVNIAEFTALVFRSCHSRIDSENYVYFVRELWDKLLCNVLGIGDRCCLLDRISPYGDGAPSFEMLFGVVGKLEYDAILDPQNRKRAVQRDTIDRLSRALENSIKTVFQTEDLFMPHDELPRIFEKRQENGLLETLLGNCFPRRVAAKEVSPEAALSLLMKHHGPLKTLATVITHRDALIPTSLLWQKFAEYLATEHTWFDPDRIPPLKAWQDAFGRTLGSDLHLECSRFWPAIIRLDVTDEIHSQPLPILKQERILHDDNLRIWQTQLAEGASFSPDGTPSARKWVFEKHIVTKAKGEPNELKIYRHLSDSSRDHKSVMKIIGCLYLGVEHGEHIYALYMDLAKFDLNKFLSQYRPDKHMNASDWRSPTSMLEEICILIEGVEYLHDKCKICLVDLHPGNIVVHLGRSSSWNHFVIIDFEHARIQQSNGLFVVTDVEGAGAFGAPERERGQALEFLCDNWPLGCIMVVLLVGLRGGPEAIDRLYSEIQKEDGSDTFYKWEGETPVLKVAVRKALWEATCGMHDIDPVCGTQFRKITRLLQSDILCPKDKRISSAEIRSRFKAILSVEESWPRPSKDFLTIDEFEAISPIESGPVDGSNPSSQRNTSSSPPGPSKDTPMADEVETTPPKEGHPVDGLIPSHQHKRPLSPSHMLAWTGTKGQRTK